MARVPPGRRDYVITQLGRDEKWSERAPQDLRVCVGHVATTNPFALFPLQDDPLWARAYKSFQSAQADASLSKSGGSLTYHPDVVALLLEKKPHIDTVLSPPRPTPIDRSELPVPPPRLSANQSAQKIARQAGRDEVSIVALQEELARLKMEKAALDQRLHATEKERDILRAVDEAGTQGDASNTEQQQAEKVFTRAKAEQVPFTMPWLLQRSDDAVRSLTALPKKGLRLLLALCTKAGFDRIFCQPRVLTVPQGRKRKVVDAAEPANAASAAGAPSPAAPSTPAPATPQPGSTHPTLSMSWQDAILMLLVRLKCDMGEQPLAELFHTTRESVCTRLTDMALLLEKVLDATVGKKRDVPDGERMKCFAKGTPFGNVKFIGDTTLLRTEKSKSHVLQRLLYSNYMPGHKFKALVCIGPDGFPNFISKLYPSTTSDREIAIHSGFLDSLKPGDVLMFDKGAMNMQADCDERGVTLLMPSVVTNNYLRLGEWHWSRLVASARVHIERVNERIKRFRWLDGVIHVATYPYASSLFRLCTLLTHFMGPLVKDGGRGLDHLGVSSDTGPATAPQPRAATVVGDVDSDGEDDDSEEDIDIDDGSEDDDCEDMM